MKLENKQGINTITMKPRAVCFCPLGDDWYTNEFLISIDVADYYPDYCDIEKFLNEKVRGKSLIIEDAVEIVYDYIAEELNPDWIEVTSCVNDVTSHSPVVVSKTSREY